MKLARVNTVLVILIVLINAFIIALPFLPAALFILQKNSAAVAKMHEMVKNNPSDTPVAADAEQLIVPAMALDTPILQSNQKSILSKGVWRLPHTSTPDKGSNTVLVAHRFTYTNPRGTFYHLDKVQPGNAIAVLWHGKKYIYRVQSSSVVHAQQTEVESPTVLPQLTLYTCTPLWNPTERLVITAPLEAIR